MLSSYTFWLLPDGPLSCRAERAGTVGGWFEAARVACVCCPEDWRSVVVTYYYVCTVNSSRVFAVYSGVEILRKCTAVVVARRSTMSCWSGDTSYTCKPPGYYSGIDGRWRGDDECEWVLLYYEFVYSH